jgi:hypothetical protein
VKKLIVKYGAERLSDVVPNNDSSLFNDAKAIKYQVLMYKKSYIKMYNYSAEFLCVIVLIKSKISVLIKIPLL